MSVSACESLRWKALWILGANVFFLYIFNHKKSEITDCVKIHMSTNFHTLHLPCRVERTHRRSDRADVEGNSRVFVLRVLRRDEARAGSFDLTIPFICSTSGASIATAGTHPSFASKGVYITYPQCTAAATRSKPQWIPRWPARHHQAALWRWCGESFPLAPKKKGTHMKSLCNFVTLHHHIYILKYIYRYNTHLFFCFCFNGAPKVHKIACLCLKQLTTKGSVPKSRLRSFIFIQLQEVGTDEGHFNSVLKSSYKEQ